MKSRMNDQCPQHIKATGIKRRRHAIISRLNSTIDEQCNAKRLLILTRQNMHPAIQSVE